MNAWGGGKGRGVYAIPVGCALLALATVLWMSDRSPDEVGASASTSLEVPDGVSNEVAEALTSSSAAPSSVDAFIGDLESAGGDAREGDAVRVLSWSDEQDLPATAEKALCAYRDHGAVTLMSSGYLDLAGNVWAALLRHDSGAVDIMTVSTGDGRSSEVRVARLEPSGL